MKTPIRIKKTLYSVIIAASLPFIAPKASAQVLLTDSFLVSSNSSNLNQQLASRQAGPLAPSKYSGWATVYQVGNTSTDVGQPGGATNGNFVLLAGGGSFFNNLPIGSVASGPLTVQFNMYLHGTNNPSTDPTTWGACALRKAGSSFPVAGAGEFGFLARANGGMQVFNNGGNIAPSGWDTTGFATNSNWTLIFSDTSGTGSAFNGNGSQVTFINGTNTLGTLALGQLNSVGLRLGFCNTGNRYVGIANLAISGTSSGLPLPGQNLSFEYDTTSPGTSINIIPTSWTGFNVTAPDHMGSQYPSGSDYTVVTPLAPTADGNQFYWVNAFNGDGIVGVYQDMGVLQPNTLYTLTVAIGSRADRINSPGIISLVNGTSNTGTVLATGGGLPATQNTWQDYTVTFATGGSVSGDLTIVLSALGAGTIQANFDNVRLTTLVSAVPLPILVSNPTPASATVAVGSNIVFTAAFSNTPPVSLQWQQIVSGVTNTVGTGVVNVTNNGVVTSTLTLNNVQPSSAGSYRLKAANATNLVTVVYSQSASLTVVPVITWYSAGAYNYTFLDNSVLALAGSVANEVYGISFGSGAQVTANGYSFDDYNSGSGNMSVVSSGLGNFSGYLGGVDTGDFAFNTILNNGVYGSSANTGTLNNLTIGQAYTVLVLMVDTRTSGASGPNFNITDGLSSSPAQRYAFPNGSPAVGGYIMGTFTAAATSQPLTVLNNGNAQYIAVLLVKGIATPPANAPELMTDVSPLLSEVTTGGPVAYSVTAGGTQPLQYQWFNQGGPISGATSTNYSFSAVAGSNSYYVVVANSFGSVTSSVATVISSTNIVTVRNFSFEDGTSGSGNAVFPLVWTPFNNNNFSAVANNNYSVVNPLAPPAQGNNFYGINEGPGDPTGGLYQDVGPLLPNTTYTLTVATGRRQDFPNPPGSLGSPGIISLINGTNNTGIVLASTNGIPATTDSWQDNTVTFITGPSVSGDLTVALSVAGASTYQANFDNVRLTKAPAPAVVPPTLITDIHPLRSEVTTGAPWTLSVAVNGNPLFYQWYNQNGPIVGATTDTFTFNAVAGSNSYYVVITNSSNSITSSVATVISATNIVTVNNFSFENGTTPAYGNGAIPLTWTAFNGDWSGLGTGPGFPAQDGTYYLAINTSPGHNGASGVYQDVGVLLPNTTYTLTVAIGRSTAAGVPPNGVGDWSPGIITLLNGGDNSGTLLATTTGYPDAVGTWQDYSASFSTGPSVSGDLTIELAVPPANTYQGTFDNVRLTKASAASTTAPIIGAPKVSGGNLIVTGTGGTPGAGYTWLTTTNLALPITSWTTNTTGTLDGAGAFSNAIPVTATTPASFFRLRMQ